MKIDVRQESVPAGVLEALLEFDSCTLANAIERTSVRLRNEGFTRPGLLCMTGGFPRIVGYAATFRVRTAEPPVSGDYFLERTCWWSAAESFPAPRIAVIEDIDAHAGAGSTAGEIHAAILKAFDCMGLVTNGSVRDIPAVSAMAFPMFAPAVSVSHSYMHLLEFGGVVEIFGLKVQPGDLLFADCHGLLSIPLKVAADLPAIAREIRANERRIIEVCQAPGFSLEKLIQVIKSTR